MSRARPSRLPVRAATLATGHTLQAFVGEIIHARYGTAKALAAAIGMSSSAFGRGVESGTLSVDNCLRLAEEVGVPATTVLTRAGKGDTAARIERLYGRAQTPALNRRDRELLARWHALSGAQREAMELVLRAFHAER